MNSAVKFIFCCALSSFCLTACGGDSSGSTKAVDDETESSESGSLARDRSSSSWAMSSATTVVDADAKDVRNTEHSHDSEVDSATGTTFATHSVGIYTWTEQNINVKSSVARNTCYAYDDSNCNPYGRLYLSNNAEKVCPTGYTLPTVSDWKNLLQAELTKTDYAGICTKRDTLECTGIGDSVRYLASDGYAVLMDRSGLFERQMARDNEFYSLRCIRYRSIVERMADLPDCEEDGDNNYANIYVVDRDSNYYCSSGKWYSSSIKRACREQETGDKYLIKGYVYICKNGSWQFTTIDDVDIRCNDDNRYEEYVVNDVRYACGDNGMVKLTYPATELGFCSPKVAGKLAEIDSANAYVCEDFLWRKAELEDYYGKCDSAKTNQIISYKNLGYICYNKSWRRTTAIEDEFGACTPKLQDSLRETKDHYYYECYYENWHKADNSLVLGNCTSEKEGLKILIGTNEYECVNNTWKQHDKMSREIGFCTTQNVGAKGVYLDTIYYCEADRGYGWQKATELEKTLGYCRRDTTVVVENSGKFYKCSGSWKEAAQSDVLGSCNSAKGEKKIFNGREFVCDTTALKSNGAWYAMTALDSALGGYCKTSLLNTGVIYDKTVYMCRKNSSNEKSWQVGNMLDYMGKCDKYVTYKRAFNGVDSSWCMCASADNCYWDAILLDSLIDERVNDYYSRYAIVTLGNQKWLNRELHYASEQAVNCNGFRIKSYSGGVQNTEFYYNWNEVFENLTTICPAGSHVATKAEWQALFDFAENLTPGYGVRALLERSNDPPHSGYNLYGVRLNRSGYVDVDTLTDISYGHGTHKLLQNSYFWLPESTSDSTASYVLIDSLFKVQYKTDGLKKDAYQVRCVVD
ncbi:FISUMP domain-containing protein [Fibrobacter sp. UWB1]|uniref:FISUMP domain-containing protein n=1 Tax=Fibrobacter sp. UWB1 TaxID=1964355 RepID=UPI0011406A3A|nr:FISUMP domain-containing protein [Fibrobacter sp. UWB1]